MTEDQAQGGYLNALARSRGHDMLKFQTYYGWKECRRLGIEYVPEPLHHCNLYIRKVHIKEREQLELSYHLDTGLIAPFDVAIKYAYPTGMTEDEKRKFRAKARRAARVK